MCAADQTRLTRHESSQCVCVCIWIHAMLCYGMVWYVLVVFMFSVWFIFVAFYFFRTLV